MTKLDLQARLHEIRKRAEAATEGDWRIRHSKHRHLMQYEIFSEDIVARITHQADAEFIAHARTDVVELIAEVERLRQALKDILETGELYHEHYLKGIAKGALE